MTCAALLAGLTACGTTSYFGGSDDGSSTGLASFTKREDLLAPPTQVGWTSARASRCGFVFDPGQLRSRYLASEAAYGRSQQEMQKIQEAYDYALSSVSGDARSDPNYCTRERVDEIRADLNRYLSGDFRVSGR